MSQRMLGAAGVMLVFLAAAGYFLWQQTVADQPAKPPASGDRAARDAGLSPAGNSRLHKDEPLPAVKPLLDGWPVPAAAFVVTGEQRGYIEPCGCSLHQLGGMSRRADLIRQIKDRGWPVAALDVGGLVNNPSRAQAKLKLAMTLKCLKFMDYAAVALGREELQIGDALLTYAETDGPSGDRPPFLASNVVLFGSPDIVSKAHRIVDLGNVKVGVVAVFGETMKEGLAGREGDLEIRDPVESLGKALAALETDRPKLLVLLSHAKVEETRKLVEKFPQFHVAVSAGSPEDPDPRPVYLGKTLLVTPGRKGKHVGVVGYYPDTEQPLRFEQVDLDEQRFQETAAIQDQMREYQESLKVHNLVAGDLAIDNPWNAQLSEPNEYVGAKVCGECHTNAYKIWQSTKHAQATDSIKRGRADGEGRYREGFISRIYDPECVNCHTTGWSADPQLVARYKTGFQSEEATPHLVGQQCENCHGPGSRHADLERRFAKDKSLEAEAQKFRDLAFVALDDAGAKLCVKCHDGDNDPHFKTDGDVFARYWKEIAHSRRD